MRFAVSLLTLLGVASIIGTVLKQNEPYQNYIIKFGQFWFELFELLGLLDVYHAAWFLLILLFLVISTALCVFRNTPVMLKEWKTYKENATEKSLRLFSHETSLSVAQPVAETQSRLSDFLSAERYTFKIRQQDNGDVLMAARLGTHQRLGYIFTHAAIVVICFGGLLDGNLPLKVQELLGFKKIETRDIASRKVPKESRLGTSNLSFRANMTLPEGERDNVAFVRVRDGYLVQDLPFTVALKDFRIEHYPTGMPKSFESDIVITDPVLNKPIEATVRVNHPYIHKGIAIYQSDFQDGGSQLKFKLWNLASANQDSFDVDGVILQKGSLGEGAQKLSVEFNEFRQFNILNLSKDGKGKPHNVGPNTTLKLRNASGQAREYVNYMQPLQLDGRAYFVSGMRETVQDEFKYLRVPADDELEITGFMALRQTMRNEQSIRDIASQVAKQMPSGNPQLKVQFEQSLQQLLLTFKRGGYSELSNIIEKAVPKDQREQAAQTYLKLLNTAALQAYQISRAQRNLAPAPQDQATAIFIQDSLNAMNDLFFYGTPYYFQLKDYTLKQASGFQLTRSPGQNWVYLGSVMLVVGIFSMFYIRERRVWLLIKPAQQEVLLAMSSNRKNMDLDQDFARMQQQLTKLLHNGPAV
ncbi:MAG TPA: cytochrome c biogenesis protein ResB [Methylophilus sp.]|uniref:cytochrome c biogenesis protein ResB n=1 Tax=Methylophilus sp. TaxID=29541 RepID=UPI002CFC8960|nr:cytochrome c biogenesis protein ResB [Methylophilus sp.]HSH85858.1 cytochrome c biogenesis protein ResB [Methylophilus sp.]